MCYHPVTVVTVKQLLKAAGVSRVTLTSWQASGLLPAPTVVPGKGRGQRGRVGYWPDSALATVRKIRKLKADGLTLDEIRHRLFMRTTDVAGDYGASVVAWLKAASVPPLDIFSATPTALAYEYAINGWSVAAEDGLKDISGHVNENHSGLIEVRAQICSRLLGQTLSETAAWFVERLSDDLIGWAYELLGAGHNPVLICEHASAPRIQPDFMIAHELAAPLRSPDEPRGWIFLRGAVVLPLGFTLLSVLEHAGVTDIPKIRSAAATTVLVRDGDALIERPYVLVARDSRRLTFSMMPQQRVVAVAKKSKASKSKPAKR